MVDITIKRHSRPAPDRPASSAEPTPMTPPAPTRAADGSGSGGELSPVRQAAHGEPRANHGWHLDSVSGV
jgi:hypothetical protein